MIGRLFFAATYVTGPIFGYFFGALRQERYGDKCVLDLERHENIDIAFDALALTIKTYSNIGKRGVEAAIRFIDDL